MSRGTLESGQRRAIYSNRAGIQTSGRTLLVHKSPVPRTRRGPCPPSSPKRRRSTKTTTRVPPRARHLERRRGARGHVQFLRAPSMFTLSGSSFKGSRDDDGYRSYAHNTSSSCNFWAADGGSTTCRGSTLDRDRLYRILCILPPPLPLTADL